MEYEYVFLLVNEITRDVKHIIVDGEVAANKIREEYNLPMIGASGYSLDRKYQFSNIAF